MKLKRALSSLVVLVLLLSCMSINAFALGNTYTYVITSSGGSWNGSSGAQAVAGDVIVVQNNDSNGRGYIDVRDLADGGNGGTKGTFSGTGSVNYTVPNGYRVSSFSYSYDYMHIVHIELVSYSKYYSITNKAPSTAAETNHGYIAVSSTAFENTSVQVSVNPSEGYELSSLTYTNADGIETAITGTSFTMPSANTTVNASFQRITTGAADLDLEESDTYPDSTTIDQYYIKTVGSSTVCINKINVNWSNSNMNIKVTDSVKWNPTNLTWDTEQTGVATVDGETNKTTVTLTNYSPKAFTCNLSFDLEEGLESKFDKCEFTVNDANLAAVDNNTSMPDETLETSVPTTATITATITPKLEGDDSFAGADATESAVKYGTFTISCTAVNN